MIISKLYGGTGNQMFQYATGKFLALRLGVEHALDISHIYYNPTRPYILDNFSISTKQKHPPGIPSVLRRRIYNALERRNATLHALYSKFFMNTKKYKTFTPENDESFEYDDAFYYLTDNTYLVGYFQNYNYFENIAPIVKKEFIPLTIADKVRQYVHYIHTLQQQNKTPIAVHIRLGDYSNEMRLPIEYYKNAIRYMQNRCADIVLFVFSDDIHLAKQLLQQLDSMHSITTVFVKNTLSPSCDYQHIHLMSTCSHAIIANSTFSWWGGIPQ